MICNTDNLFTTTKLGTSSIPLYVSQIEYLLLYEFYKIAFVRVFLFFVDFETSL